MNQRISSGRRYTRSNVQNLYRYVREDGSYGHYYGIAKIGDRKSKENLNTYEYDVAVRRLNKWMEGVRKLRSRAKRAPRNETFKVLFEEYERNIDQDTSLKPNSKEAKRYTLERLKKTWPELENTRPSKLTVEAVKNWHKRFKSDGTGFVAPGAKKRLAGNSASTINKTTSALIQIMDMAVSKGLAADNVVKQNIQLEKLHVREEAKLGDIPSKEDFNRILEHLTSTDAGKPFAFGMKLLAYSGCRIDESRSLKWNHIDFEIDRIHIPGTKTKSSDRVIPMTPDLAALLKQAHEKAYSIAGDDTSEQKVMPVHCLNNRLRSVCKALGVLRFSNHDLRDYFATTALEHGVPIHTIAGWLGHADGGALLLKRYSHLREEHSAEQARKLRF